MTDTSVTRAWAIIGQVKAEQKDARMWTLLQLCALCLPGSVYALEGVLVEQREDCAVVGQQASCYVDHPLTLLIGLYEMEMRLQTKRKSQTEKEHYRVWKRHKCEDGGYLVWQRATETEKHRYRKAKRLIDRGWKREGPYQIPACAKTWSKRMKLLPPSVQTQ